MKDIVIAGFPITPEMGLKRRGTHFDVPYEVSNHGRDQSESLRGSQGTWCYYVTVDERMVDAETFANFWLPPGEMYSSGRGPSYDYMSADFASLHWHGGITYYEKLGGLDGAPRAVKMGCDFAHYWDQGRTYDFADVEYEAKQTIDEMRERYVFRRQCVYSGKWFPESDLVDNGKGHLISKEVQAEREGKS
jgi:hypothetical protein